MAATVHNIDQQTPLITFDEHPLEAAVECEQFGSKTKSFVPGTSSVIWPSAMLLSRHLCAQQQLVNGKRCVELGSGTGMVGLVAAALGAQEVVLTDFEEGLPLLERNILRNKGQSRAVELIWGDEEHISRLGRHKFDLVLASDVICHQDEEVMEQLARTMASLVTPSGVCLLAYEFRDDWLSAGNFQDAAKACGLHVDSAPLQAPDDVDDDFFLYTLRPSQNLSVERSNGSQPGAAGEGEC